ncbi:hypothetical protein NDA10_004440 [Ustilago hordei]|nr:hypothetical protein NDA10_004440 [Ustilago hordei]
MQSDGVDDDDDDVCMCHQRQSDVTCLAGTLLVLRRGCKRLELQHYSLLTAATVTLALLEFGRNSSLPLTRLARRLVHLAPPSTFPPPSTSPPSTSLYLAPPSTSLYLAPPSTSPPSTSLYLAPPSTSLYLAPPSTSLHLAVDQHQVPRSPCSFSASAFLIDSTRLNHPTCTTLS